LSGHFSSSLLRAKNGATATAVRADYKVGPRTIRHILESEAGDTY
jgi:hypothetical protein